MHLDEELIQRLLDRELASAAERSAREHLVRCDECRARLVAAEREEAELAGLLRLLDHPAPPVTPAAIATAARRNVRRRWAAAMLLSAGLAGAAYAAPGSPLRGWVGALVERVGDQSPLPAPVAPEVQAPESAPAGVAVAPGDHLVVSFDSAQAVGQVRVSLSEAAELMVRAPGGTVTFTSEPELLSIHNRGAVASYALEIPRSAPRVEIRVAGAPIFLKEGERVTARAGAPPAGGVYRLPLQP